MNMSTTFSMLLFLFGALNFTTATTTNLSVTVDANPSFIINGKDVCVDETFVVPVSVTDFEMITSFQYTIAWDTSLMTFDTISFVSPVLGNSFLFNNMNSGVLAISWLDQDVAGITVDDFTELFHIQFTSIAPNQTAIDITFENEPTMKEVSGYVGNDIVEIEAIYVEDGVNVDHQELDSYEVINDVNESNIGEVNITVKNGTAPYTYVWSNDVETQNLTNVGVGDYMVTVTDSKGCEAVFGEFTVDNTVGTNDLQSLQSISLFPNPANNLMHVNAVFENVEALEISVFDILGKRVLFAQQEAVNLDIDLDVSNLTNGTYILQLRTEDGSHTEKIEILR